MANEVTLQLQSNPSRTRTVAALVFYVIAGVAAILWKAFRDDLSNMRFLPVWIIGGMPNFIPAAFMPMLLFITRRTVRPREYFGVVLAILGALCAYEVAQIWMPKRTFDWADVAASAAGSCLACLLGWSVFFQWLGTPAAQIGSNVSKS